MQTFVGSILMIIWKTNNLNKKVIRFNGMIILVLGPMPNPEYFNIDGAQIRKTKPFIVYFGMPRNTSEFHLSDGGKSDNVNVNPSRT